MKKILGLSVAALLVMGLVGSGTWAYFSDTETSTGNTFAAGTLDLTVNSTDTNQVMFTVGTLKPGDDDGGDPGTLSLENIGSAVADLSINTTGLTNTESSGGTEFEGDGAPGELGGYLQISVWIDMNANAAYNDGTDVRLLSNNTTASSGSLTFDTINNYGSCNWADAITGMAQNDEVDLMVEWEFTDNSANQNDAQGDSVSLDFGFELQ